MKNKEIINELIMERDELLGILKAIINKFDKQEIIVSKQEINNAWDYEIYIKKEILSNSKIYQLINKEEFLKSYSRNKRSKLWKKI